MRSADFFVWQGVGGIHSGAMDDEHNAGRRKKTRFHGMLCLGIGIRYVAHPLPMPEISINVFRHAKYHKEPGSQWLRSLLFDAFAD